MEFYHLVLGRISTNVYILCGTDGAVVIDPADEPEKILEIAAKAGKQIKYALLTHAHFDHCSAAAALQKQGVEIIMGAKEAEFLADGGHLAKVGFNFEIFTPDRLLDGGETLELCGMEFKAIPTPGHTVGGMSYVCEDMLFCGDTLFRRGIGRTDLPSGSYKDIIKSVGTLLALPGDMTVYPGHEAFSTLSYERENNPYV